MDAVVFNSAAPAAGAYLMQFVPGKLHLLQEPAKQIDIADFINEFKGQRVHAVAGIGHPQRFFNQLELLGLTIVPHAFPDHHAYTPQDLQFAAGEPVIMTEKDAVKCVTFAQSDWWFMPISAEIDRALMDKIQTLLASLQYKE